MSQLFDRVEARFLQAIHIFGSLTGGGLVAGAIGISLGDPSAWVLLALWGLFSLLLWRLGPARLGTMVYAVTSAFGLLALGLFAGLATILEPAYGEQVFAVLTTLGALAGLGLMLVYARLKYKHNWEA